LLEARRERLARAGDFDERRDLAGRDFDARDLRGLAVVDDFFDLDR
jgi:hypothetical protein